MSNFRRVSSKKRRICNEPNSSDGLGIMAPQAMRDKFGTCVGCVMEEKVAMLLRKSDKPGFFLILNVLCKTPRSRSASTNSVLVRCCARMIARLLAVNDLPSSGWMLVRSSVWIGPVYFENMRWVRKARYDSPIGVGE
jgi:hypothetical protein